ncbi:MAG: hypothetical protein DCC73_11415 [Proteobacteria bacterium]|nr:MAG: hypothetical protein DCC73_11415 [Pseudomonadota bacterium]
MTTTEAADAAAPAATTTTAPAAATGASAGQGGEATAPDWLATLPDALQGEPTLKLFKDVPALAQSYVEVRKAIGQDKVILPKDADDAAGWDRVYRALGRPEAADKYELPAVEEADQKFLSAYCEVAFQNGLNNAQAKNLMDFANARAAEIQKAEDDARQARLAQEEAALKAEWGAAYDANDAIANRAIQRFGMGPDHFKAFRDSMGFAASMKFLHKLGAALGEAGFVPDGQPAVGAMTPAQAQAEIAVLQKDKGFGDKLLNKDAEAKKKWDQLHAWAVGQPG